MTIATDSISYMRVIDIINRNFIFCEEKTMEIKELITEAIKITGLKTEEEVIELSLKTLINLKEQEKIRQEGNLEEMRLD